LAGLGDTNYSEFCGCPKGLDKKLTDLGAEPFYKMGLADDAVGCVWIQIVLNRVPNT
jgi:methionine synthase reductase